MKKWEWLIFGILCFSVIVLGVIGVTAKLQKKVNILPIEIIVQTYESTINGLYSNDSLQVNRLKAHDFEINKLIQFDIKLREIQRLYQQDTQQKLQEIQDSKIEMVSLEDTIQRTIESVVHIVNETGHWQGSGVAITKDIIVTARHMVESGFKFTITLNDGQILNAQRAISSKKYDLGFIKVSDPNLTPAKFGSIEGCRLGQAVYVVGSPYGKVNFNSITLGIVSGLNRDCDEFNNPWEGDYGWSIAFTTDAAGHPGNSGCPVFTMDGIVRGILVGGHSPVLIYCMPIDLIIEDIKLIEMMFLQDKYRIVEGILDDPYYNEEEDSEYY